MDDFAWGAKLTPPRVVSLGSDLSKKTLFIETYEVTCICTYPLKEHVYGTTSIEQHIHALLFAYLCYNEYRTTYTCVYTLEEHTNAGIIFGGLILITNNLYAHVFV